MIEADRLEYYRMMLKDSSMTVLLEMMAAITDELLKRHENKYPLLEELPHIHHEIFKLKTFMQTVNTMLKYPKNEIKQDILQEDLINNLHGSGFSVDEAKLYIKKAMQNGQIYEKRTGFYAVP
jgi:hypothetical protein